jgi:hypothetical protein
LKKKIERELKLPFFDQLVELARERIKSLSDTQIAYYAGVIITGVEKRFVLRNKENFTDEQSFTFWFLSKGLAQLDLSRQKKIIGHIQHEEFEHGNFTLAAIHDLITAAGGVIGDHYDQEGDIIVPTNEGWKLLDRVFKSEELTALRNSLINQNDENFVLDTPLSTTRDDLSSERFGANYYIQLRDLLKAGKWKEADRETADRMCEVMDRQKEGWLRPEDIKMFPSQDLQHIDHLWVTHSNGKFGFSVQKKLFLNCGPNEGGFYGGSIIFNKFGDSVGWRVKGSWISYKHIIFDTLAPDGHLPSPWGWWVLWRQGNKWDRWWGAFGIGMSAGQYLFLRRDL